MNIIKGRRAQIKVIVGIILVLLLFVFLSLYMRSSGGTMADIVRNIFMVGR